MSRPDGESQVSPTQGRSRSEDRSSCSSESYSTRSSPGARHRPPCDGVGKIRRRPHSHPRRAASEQELEIEGVKPDKDGKTAVHPQHKSEDNLSCLGRSVEVRAPECISDQSTFTFEVPSPLVKDTLPLLAVEYSNNALSPTDASYENAQAAIQAGEGSIVVDSEALSMSFVDNNTDDDDAGYASDVMSSGSTSLSSSVREYAFENGRRYHKFREGRYNFPNDDVEQEREDMKHAMVAMLCQRLHFAPIGDHPQEVLDIGCGTGAWAIEMGDHYDSANILGVDLSPIQPGWVPPNVRFMVDDVESVWLHPRNHFDYIHSRHTVMAIKDWPTLLWRAKEHLRPGGWIELQEIHHFPYRFDNSMPPEHLVARYWSLITAGLAALGINFAMAQGGHMAELLREAGYINVTERVFQVPLGTWPKNKTLKSVGLYWRTILLDGIQAIALGPLTRGLHWNREQVELFLIEVRRAYHDNSCLMYMPLHIVYGQKPRHGY